MHIKNNRYPIKIEAEIDYLQKEIDYAHENLEKLENRMNYLQSELRYARQAVGTGAQKNENTKKKG